MVTNLKIHGFKSIESAELELGNINVIIGANGSGKSNLLEAVAVSAAAAFGRVDEESLVRRGCRPGGIFEPMFPTNSLPLNSLASERHRIEVEVSGATVTYSIALAAPVPTRPIGFGFLRETLTSGSEVVVDRPDPGGLFKGDPQVGLAALKLAEMAVTDSAAIFLRSLAAFSIYTPDTLVLRGFMQDPQTRQPIGLSGGRLAEAVNEVMGEQLAKSKLVEELRACFDWVMDVLPVEVRNPANPDEKSAQIFFLDRFFRANAQGGRYALLPRDVNEGVLYFLLLGVICLHPKSPRFLALDNADHGLNPVLARRLTGTVCKWLLEASDPRQVLMTTQNPLILDGLPLDDARVRLFIADRDNRGTTVIRRFVVEDKHRNLAKQDWTLSRMWVNGLIGGIPNV